MVYGRLHTERNEIAKYPHVTGVSRRIQMAPSVVAVVRIRAVGNQQLDALKAAGANRGAERDVTVRVRRVDDAGVRSGNLGDPVLISYFDCRDKLLTQRPPAHAMRSLGLDIIRTMARFKPALLSKDMECEANLTLREYLLSLTPLMCLSNDLVLSG